MNICVTKKLIDAIPFDIATTNEEEGDPLFSWHANILLIDRRKTLVLMNDKNRYVVALYGMKAQDFKRLDELIPEAIRQAFQAERIREDVIDEYLNKVGPVTFYKTKNRSLISMLTQASDAVWFAPSDFDLTTLIQLPIGKEASRMMTGEGFIPATEMVKDLEQLIGSPIFLEETVIMHISLSLGEHSIWRRVSLPLDLSFTDFHRMMQVLFNWHDSHLHEFHLYDETLEREENLEIVCQPAIKIVMCEDTFEYEQDAELQTEDGLRLVDFIPPNRFMKYVYDFGDNWEHEIVVEEFVKDPSLVHPICLAGEGTAPPEDCGGESGFEEYLAIMADPAHPDYSFMKQWAQQQQHEEFDRERINWQLGEL